MTPLILSLLLVLIVAVSALIGFVRGFSKSVIRIITLVLALALTFVLSAPITNAIVENVKFNGETIGEVLLSVVQGKNEMLDNILASAPLLEEAILTAPEFVIGFVIFPVAFLLLSFVSWLLFAILQKPLRFLFFKEKEKVKVGAGKRFAGLGIGAVTGVLIFAMLITPLFGLISVLPEKSALDDVVDVLVEQDAISAELGEIIKGELAVMESPIYTIPASLGISPIGKTYLDSVSKIERDGEVTHLTEEFDTLFAVVQTAVEGELINAVIKSMETQPADMNPLYTVLSDEAFVKELIGDMFDSKLLRSAVPEVMAIALESAARMLGVPENKQEVYENMMEDIATLVKDSDVDFEAIKAYEEAKNITYVDVMYADEQPAPIMTEEEYNEEIEKLGELEDKIAKVVNKNVAGGSKAVADGIAKEFIKGVKEQVKNEGAESLKTFNTDSAKKTMSEVKPENIEVDGEDSSAISGMLGKIQNPETFETDLATVETVKENIRETVNEAVKDDSKATETANAIAGVVSNFAGAVAGATNEDGTIDHMKLDFEKVGNAVGALQGSTLDGVGSVVLDIVVSGDLGDNDMISSAVGGIKEAYNEGKPIADTVKTAGDVIKVVDAMNKSEGAATEDFAKSFENLVRGLKESTLDLLPSILKTEVLVSFGIPKEYASSSYSVIETLMRELVKLQGAEDYENEVNAVISLYNLATGDIKDFKEEDIPGVVDYAIKSDAIYNTLNSISSSNPFGIKIENEADRTRIAGYIEKYYAEDKAEEADKQRVYDVYMAVAKILGLENEVTLAK